MIPLVSPRNQQNEQAAVARDSNNNQQQRRTSSTTSMDDAITSMALGKLKTASPTSHLSAADERSVSSKLPQTSVLSPCDTSRNMTTQGNISSNSRQSKRRRQRNRTHKSNCNLFALLMQQGQNATVEADALRREVREAHQNSSLVAVRARKEALQLVQVRTRLLNSTVVRRKFGRKHVFLCLVFFVVTMHSLFSSLRHISRAYCATAFNPSVKPVAHNYRLTRLCHVAQQRQ